MAATFCYPTTISLLFLLFLLPIYSINFQFNGFNSDDANILYLGSAVSTLISTLMTLTHVKLEGPSMPERCYFGTRSLANSLTSQLTTPLSLIPKNKSSLAMDLPSSLLLLTLTSLPILLVAFLAYSTSQQDLLHRTKLFMWSSILSQILIGGETERHVGINNNSIVSAVSTPWNTSLHSGDIADVWISYDSKAKNLSVSWKYQNTSDPQEQTSLSLRIDLMKVLPEWVTIGFSAATGARGESHNLLSWEFNSTLDQSGGGNTNKTGLVVILTVSCSGLLVLGAIIAYALFRRKNKKRSRKEEAMNLSSINYDLERGAGPRRFSYRELSLATNNFSKERMLGKGGFGAVYRGYFSYLDLSVAVKKISRGSKQGKKEYVTEVKVISQLRHRNLVQLLGWCHDKGEFLLVYEFMPNGSLDSHLFGKRTHLSWILRHKIGLGLASAVLYLHEEWERCVVHRDIKSSNIMLDSSFNVKLGDFGLAKLMGHELGPQTTGLAGTLGYLAPEYVSTGRASKE